MVFWPKQSLLVWIESIQKFFEFGPLITKVKHNLAHQASSPIALNFTTRLLLQRLISLRAISYTAQFHSAHSTTALIFIPRILLERLLSLFGYNHKLFECSPFSFHLKAQNTSRTSPAPSSVGLGSTSPPAPALFPPHPSPSITVGHPTNLQRGGVVAPPPDPNSPPPPNTVSQSRSLGMGDENSVCVCMWGWGVRGQASPSPNGSLYRNTEDMGIILACLISRIPLRRLVSFRAFSYGA